MPTSSQTSQTLWGWTSLCANPVDVREMRHATGDVLLKYSHTSRSPANPCAISVAAFRKPVVVEQVLHVVEVEAHLDHVVALLPDHHTVGERLHRHRDHDAVTHHRPR